MVATLDEILQSHRTHKPIVMGVLNITPDSFSNGGEYLNPDDAIAAADKMIRDGADIIDIGAESTRPGSDRVSADEQIRRLEPVLPKVCSLGRIVSIDTTLAEVARFALDAGASIINDVSAGRDDVEMFNLAAKREVPIILMHMLGEPKTMQENPHYDDVVGEVRQFLSERITAAVEAGIERSKIIIDPGIGFGKLLNHNLALLRNINSLVELDVPVLIGPSRKRFIAEISQNLLNIRPVEKDRLGGTIAAVLAGYRQGATIFRVHDVAPVIQALATARAIENSLI